MKSPDNIREVINLAPDYLGFIFYPGSKRFVADLDPEEIRNIPSAIRTTGVFVNHELSALKETFETYQLKAVQLHGDEDLAYCAALKGSTEVIKAFGIDENFDFDSLTPYADVVDYFLFDTQTPAHGGSGKTFNWQLLQNYTLERPYFLSGGIGPESVAQLLEIKDPRLYAIDVNSRFETEPGLKNIEELTLFKKLIYG